MQHVDLYKSVADAAYQGAPGAYSEEAALALLGAKARLMPCATLEQTFDAVTNGQASHAVVPVESAIAGTVPNVYEMLLARDLVVAGEKSINIDYVLVAPPGTTRAAVRRVMSHPLALAQCADFFRTNRGLEAVYVFDTAGAVRLAIESGDGRTAAIASRRAASLYGADIIGEHIQDHPENWTRFLLLSAATQQTQIEAPEKALVAFGLKHEPGALVRALQPLAAHGLSVTKIEGRPLPGAQFEYRFLVEMVAPEGGTVPLEAIQGLKQAATWLKVLGAFRL